MKVTEKDGVHEYATDAGRVVFVVKDGRVYRREDGMECVVAAGTTPAACAWAQAHMPVEDEADDEWATLLTRLRFVEGCLRDNAEHVPLADAVAEAVELLRTHALPEDHPESLR